MTLISESEVRKIIQQGENEKVEFKTSLRDASILVQYVSALANTHGGTILVGIQEPRIVVGTQREQIDQIVERAKRMLTPSINLCVNTVNIDQKAVVVIAVPESKEVVFGNGMALKRVGGQNRPLSPQDIAQKISVPADAQEIRKLAHAISMQTQTINELRNDLRESNSFKRKLKDYLIGGFIGTILGAIAAVLIG